jgi:hypothetical protein
MMSQMAGLIVELSHQLTDGCRGWRLLERLLEIRFFGSTSRETLASSVTDNDQAKP